MLHHYNSFENIRPYALAGLGYEDFSDEYGKTNDSVAINLGLGLKYSLDNNWNLRAEIRDHVNLQESIEQELIYTVGLGYSFGYEAPKKMEEKVEKISGDKVKQTISVLSGINKELGKRIIRIAKDHKLKAQGSIQGETVRFSGNKRDALQDVIALLKEEIKDIPLQYKNFRD